MSFDGFSPSENEATALPKPRLASPLPELDAGNGAGHGVEVSQEPPRMAVLGRRAIEKTGQNVDARATARVALERWEGAILELVDDGFIARLTKGSFAKGPDEEAEFDIEEVSDHDRALVKPGARFYWSVGYETLPWGQRQRFSEIRFRRDPPLTETDVETARREAARRARLLAPDASGT